MEPQRPKADGGPLVSPSPTPPVSDRTSVPPSPPLPLSPSPRGPRLTVSHLRWWIGALLFASTVINYIDRQTINVLAPFLKAEYHWTNSDFALIVISFRLSYAVVQFLGGRLVDVLGTRRGLSVTVAWYSVMAMLTSLSRGLWSFCGFRFLLGAG